jgi:hypothetical protein
MNLKVNSVAKYDSPKYPTNDVLGEHPELLKLVPKRWRGNPTVIAALTGLCLLASAHGAGATQEGTAKSQPRIAPIFQHGDGRGSFGCIATNPPVVLSEEEARELINEEAKKAGLVFAPDTFTCPQVVAPPKHRTTPPDQIPPFKFDGTDKRLNISYEFMSKEDGETWRLAESPIVHTVTTRLNGVTTVTMSGGGWSSVYTDDLLTYATSLRGRLVTAEVPGASVVFYDPMTVPVLNSRVDLRIHRIEINKATEDQPRGQIPGASAAFFDPTAAPAANSTTDYLNGPRDEAKKASAEQLRQQVRDFIKWLKAQGVI